MMEAGDGDCKAHWLDTVMGGSTGMGVCILLGMLQLSKSHDEGLF
jgi:hypothetical protein